jgi:hypothetical protein
MKLSDPRPDDIVGIVREVRQLLAHGASGPYVLVRLALLEARLDALLAANARPAPLSPIHAAPRNGFVTAVEPFGAAGFTFAPSGMPDGGAGTFAETAGTLADAPRVGCAPGLSQIGFTCAAFTRVSPKDLEDADRDGSGPFAREPQPGNSSDDQAGE